MDEWIVDRLSAWLRDEGEEPSLAIMISLRVPIRSQPNADDRRGDYLVTYFVDRPNDATLDERIDYTIADFERETGTAWQGVVLRRPGVR